MIGISLNKGIFQGKYHSSAVAALTLLSENDPVVG